MVGIDFNSSVDFGQNSLFETLKGLANVHRKNSFLTNDRPPAKTQVRRMCWPIPWQLSDKNFLLLRSIPLYGFCSDNISPESSGHRDLPASDEVQVIPHGWCCACRTRLWAVAPGLAFSTCRSGWDGPDRWTQSS